MGARVTQAPAEVLATSNVLRARVTQAPLEVLATSNVLRARVTQVAVEVLVKRGGIAFTGEPGGGVW